LLLQLEIPISPKNYKSGRALPFDYVALMEENLGHWGKKHLCGLAGSSEVIAPLTSTMIDDLSEQKLVNSAQLARMAPSDDPAGDP